MNSNKLIPVYAMAGGIHPPENKQQSAQWPIETAAIPNELVFPLHQPTQALSDDEMFARCLVKIGDHVLKGQLIATEAMLDDDTSANSTPVHASTSGTVTAIEKRPIAHASGLSVPCIVIKSDGLDKWIRLPENSPYTNESAEQLIEKIRLAGITGLGGANFPTAKKLSAARTGIHTLIINGAECEPYITADDRLMREYAAQIVDGILILQYLLKPQKTIIGIEDNKPEAIAAMRLAAQGKDIHIVSFPAIYPSGGEKQLIHILTGKQLPHGKLPVDTGIICQNIATVAAITNAIINGKPLISRITTLTGNALKKQQNVDVLFGTPVRDLLNQYGFEETANARVIMGGSMTGLALSSLDVPVTATTNCLLAPTLTELPLPDTAQACIRCGDCAEVCPMQLLPQQLFAFARTENHEALQEHHLFDCIECGACDFVCPSNIPLVQHYRLAKADIQHNQAEKEKADYLKMRFESRMSRLATIEREKDAKRLERQQKAAMNAVNTVTRDSTESSHENTVIEKQIPVIDPVQAALERVKAKAAAKAAAEAASNSTTDAAVKKD